MKLLKIFFVCFQILHEKVHDVIVDKLKKAYAQVPIGDPTERKNSFISMHGDNNQWDPLIFLRCVFVVAIPLILP